MMRAERAAVLSRRALPHSVVSSRNQLIRSANAVATAKLKGGRISSLVSAGTAGRETTPSPVIYFLAVPSHRYPARLA
jgi:hypothetical protein